MRGHCHELALDTGAVCRAGVGGDGIEIRSVGVVGDDLYVAPIHVVESDVGEYPAIREPRFQTDLVVPEELRVEGNPISGSKSIIETTTLEAAADVGVTPQIVAERVTEVERRRWRPPVVFRLQREGAPEQLQRILLRVVDLLLVSGVAKSSRQICSVTQGKGQVRESRVAGGRQCGVRAGPDLQRHTQQQLGGIHSQIDEALVVALLIVVIDTEEQACLGRCPGHSDLLGESVDLLGITVVEPSKSRRVGVSDAGVLVFSIRGDAGQADIADRSRDMQGVTGHFESLRLLDVSVEIPVVRILVPGQAEGVDELHEELLVVVPQRFVVQRLLIDFGVLPAQGHLGRAPRCPQQLPTSRP